MIASTCVWLTGRSGAGKRTVGTAVVDELLARGRSCALLDAEAIARNLVPGPDALAWCCRMLVDHGVTTVVTLPVASRDERELLRSAIPGFVEVYVDAPPEVCAARAGHADETFEEPYAPDLRVPTHGRDVAASAAQVVSFLEDRGVMPHDPPHPSDHGVA
jgi:adenylylsulfate kinase